VTIPRVPVPSLRLHIFRLTARLDCLAVSLASAHLASEKRKKLRVDSDAAVAFSGGITIYQPMPVPVHWIVPFSSVPRAEDTRIPLPQSRRKRCLAWSEFPCLRATLSLNRKGA
jgi:hypothetical protein